MDYELYSVVNFLTSYNKKRSNIFRDVLRYVDYKRIKSNYTFKNLSERPTYNLLSEFVYNYQIMDRLFRLSENKEYKFISLDIKNIIHNNENTLLTNDYDIYILTVQLPNEKMIISWDTVAKEVEFHISDFLPNSNRIYTVSGDSNDYSAIVLEITQYTFDKILDDYWDTDINELNKSTISIVDMMPSNFKIGIDYVDQTEYFTVHDSTSRDVYIDSKIHAMTMKVEGCVYIEDVYYKYECSLIINYMDYYTEDKNIIFPYIYNQIESKKNTIRDKLEFCVSSLVYNIGNIY